MQSTLSTLFDSHHILHPKQMDNIGDHHEPALFRRILGVVLLALSLPLTLGVAPAFFAYWAHRKVSHVEQRDRTELEETTDRLFKKRVQGKEPSEEQKTFETVFKAVQKRGTLEAQALPKEMENSLTQELMNAALEYDNVAAAVALKDKYDNIKDRYDNIKDKYDNISVDLSKMKSAGMIRELMIHPFRIKGDKNSLTKLLNCIINSKSNSTNSQLPNLAVITVVKECVDAGAEFPYNLVFRGIPEDLEEYSEVEKYLMEKFSAEFSRMWEDFFADPNLAFSMVFKKHVDEMVKCPSIDLFGNCNYSEFVKFLMEKFSAKLNQKVAESGESPLFIVQNAEVLKALIEGGLDVQTEDSNGRTILHRMNEPTFRDHPELVSLIVGKVDEDKRDAFVNRIAKEPQHSPLTLNPGPKMIKALQEAGAKYPKLVYGDTFLHSKVNLETAKALVEAYGVDIVNQKNNEGFTPIFSRYISAEVAAYLIEQGADLTLKVKSGKNPPMNALFFAKDVAVAKALIDGGIDPRELDTLKGNALFGFISPEVAQYLIKEHGLKVDAKDTNGKEPIHYILENNLEMAEVLIGDRRSDHDWGDNEPPVMKNQEFIAWLKLRETQ